VTEYKARMRSVYLPGTGDDVLWYDFWTGAVLQAGGTTQPATVTPSGGMRIEAAAPFDKIPLHVRAGTILPTGPELQYTTEKKADPLTVIVYTGADGTFSLYEDDGLTYGYEKGGYARIPMVWNEGRKTLTVGKREGSFAGMLGERTIRVVFVTPQKGVGFSFDMKADRTLRYDGAEVVVRP
jgi:alpha-D-xyloside xylohydrolase